MAFRSSSRDFKRPLPLSRRESDMRREMLNVIRSCSMITVVSCAVPNVTAAQSHMHENSAKRGYIALGQKPKEEFRLDRDTLWQLSPKDVPALAREHAAVEAKKARYTNACTRYFGGPRIFVALLRAACAPGETPDDGERLMAMRSDGSPIGRVIVSPVAGDYSVELFEDRE